MGRNVERSKLPWQTAKFNPGVILVGEIKTVEAILVRDTVVCIIPPWPLMTHEAKSQLVKAFGGTIVYIEVKVSYETTGQYFNPEDLKNGRV